MPLSSDPTVLDVLPFPALIGDIGGTNARFAIVPEAHGEPKLFPIVQTADYASIDEAIQTVVLDHTALLPRSAVLAVAGPVEGASVSLTNAAWVIEPVRLLDLFRFQEAILLNDFEALALALPSLDLGDLDPLGGGTAAACNAKVVLGPGTGLGAAVLLHARHSWVPMRSEAGHMDIGPRTDREMALWPHLEKLDGGRVSAEWLVSGRGLVRLYRAVAAAQGTEPQFDQPGEVTAAGLAASDAAAMDTLDLFAGFLGRYAGDLALAALATGGVYLAGGVALRLAPFLKRSRFRESFVDKQPHRQLIEKMATMVITHDRPALVGLKSFVQTPRRFAVDLDGRHWRR